MERAHLIQLLKSQDKNHNHLSFSLFFSYFFLFFNFCKHRQNSVSNHRLNAPFTTALSTSEKHYLSSMYVSISTSTSIFLSLFHYLYIALCVTVWDMDQAWKIFLHVSPFLWKFGFKIQINKKTHASLSRITNK